MGEQMLALGGNTDNAFYNVRPSLSLSHALSVLLLMLLSHAVVHRPRSQPSPRRL